MNIVGICGSHRKKENTFKALKEALRASEADTDIIYVSDLHIEPCRACYDVCSKEPYTCCIPDDFCKVFQKMVEADGIILASPLYSPVLVPSRLAALTERFSCTYFFESLRRGEDNGPLSGKPCGLITVSGGSGTMGLLKLLANIVLLLQLDLVTMKYYPYFGVWVKSPVEEDRDGMNRARELGVNLAQKLLHRY